jgi:hypothetical protein
MSRPKVVRSYLLFDSGFPTSNTQALPLGYNGCFFCLHEPHHR